MNWVVTWEFQQKDRGIFQHIQHDILHKWSWWQKTCHPMFHCAHTRKWSKMFITSFATIAFSLKHINLRYINSFTCFPVSRLCTFVVSKLKLPSAFCRDEFDINVDFTSVYCKNTNHSLMQKYAQYLDEEFATAMAQQFMESNLHLKWFSF